MKRMVDVIYLLNQSNFDEKIIDLITLFNDVPMTKSRKSNVVEIKFVVELEIKKDDKNYAIICIDSTHGENFNYEQMKYVANNSDIKCSLPRDGFEIDHIVPLAAGGNSDCSNFQI